MDKGQLSVGRSILAKSQDVYIKANVALCLLDVQICGHISHEGGIGSETEIVSNIKRVGSNISHK